MISPSRFAPSLAALATAALLASGCSSFHREWKAALARPLPDHAFLGPWEGSWLSETNGHTGRLRCLIVPGTNDTYLARFHAKYQKILGFGYTVTLEAEPTDQGFRFRGQADLGKMAGGHYRYEGQSSATNFFSTYQCSTDHGTFEMFRPEP